MTLFVKIFTIIVAYKVINVKLFTLTLNIDFTSGIFASEYY